MNHEFLKPRSIILYDRTISTECTHRILEDLRVFCQLPPSLPPSLASRELPNPFERRSSYQRRVDPRCDVPTWSVGRPPPTSGRMRCTSWGRRGGPTGGGRNTPQCPKEPWQREMMIMMLSELLWHYEYVLCYALLLLWLIRHYDCKYNSLLCIIVICNISSLEC